MSNPNSPVEMTRVRRRLVQSTLFPHRESSVKEAVDCDGGEFGEAEFNKEEEEQETEEEGEEWCSNGKKRKGHQRKANSKAKTTRASSKKVTANGKETSSKNADDENSPVVVKSDFFIRASERVQQKRKQKEPVCFDSPDENEETSLPPNSAANDTCTPPNLKRRANSTPKKERMSTTPKKRMNSTPKKKIINGLKESNITADEQTPKTIPNLRLEAKLTAEENSRIFAGRQIHPFFTSRKVGKTCQESIDVESYERKDKGISFSPIHVFANAEDDEVILDWGHWVFSERSSIGTSGALEYGSLPEGSVNSLHFDTFLSVSEFTKASLDLNKTTLDQCSFPQIEVCLSPHGQPECSHAISSLLMADEQVTHYEQQKDSMAILKDIEGIVSASVEVTLDWQDHTPVEIDSFTENYSCANSNAELQDRLLQERIMSHYHSCRNQPENCLWTDKYQPEKAMQVCGNSEAVKFLSEWLHLWHTRGSLSTRRCTDKTIVQDMDHDYYQSDYNSDAEDEEDVLKNVLLVTGPVGSGKSSAIYACASEKGFQVIEINASDWRNGALVKQKFGEAVESHWHQCTTEDPSSSDYRPSSKSLPAVTTEIQCSGNEVIEVVLLSEDADSHNIGARPERSVCREKKAANHQNEIKTLILFEDVDATLCEDHGFISTIQQLAETAKRPMILTSNSSNPVLPKSLDRLELRFSVPSVKELFGLLHVVLEAEKTAVDPCLVERFIDYCRGDIRKIIMHLQFWCQGQSPRPANICFTDEPDPMKEKKEAMLRLHSLVQDDGGLAHFDLNKEFSDSSHSPIAFTRRNGRRKIDAVFSDSEGECSGERIPLPSGEIFEDISDDTLEMKGMSIDHCSPTENCNLLFEKIDCSEAGKLRENCCQLAAGVDNSLRDDTWKSLDTHYVPESSFVPETDSIDEGELISATVSYGHFSDMLVAESITQDLNPSWEPVSGDKILQSLHKLPNDILGTKSDTDTISVHQEEVGDSLSKHEDNVPRRYQVLDECSRVDFFERLKFLDNPEPVCALDSLQETWKNLHRRCKDFEPYVTLEEKHACQVLDLAHGMSNLISEADLLLRDCQALVCDSVEPPMIPCEKSHSYSSYDDQLQISSVLAQHGMCYYAKETAALGSITGSISNMDLAAEMLESSLSTMALGKLAIHRKRKIERLKMKPPKNCNLLRSKFDSCLYNVLQSVVPSKSYLAVNGGAFHEYLSTLSQISRSEDCRITECVDKRKRRRGRVARHYLSSGSLAFSPEEISLLGQHNSYTKVSSRLRDDNFR